MCRISSPGAYSLCSANSTDCPWCGRLVETGEDALGHRAHAELQRSELGEDGGVERRGGRRLDRPLPDVPRAAPVTGSSSPRPVGPFTPVACLEPSQVRSESRRLHPLQQPPTTRLVTPSLAAEVRDAPVDEDVAGRARGCPRRSRRCGRRGWRGSSRRGRGTGSRAGRRPRRRSPSRSRARPARRGASRGPDPRRTG